MEAEIRNLAGKPYICLFVLLSAVPSVAYGDELFVPSVGYETIQSAIESANPGDEIIVARGLYTENLNFRGKAITVRSEDPDDPNVVAETVIDGSEPADPNFGSVVIFHSGEGNDSVLTGFTITGGTGSWIVVSWEFKGVRWNRCGGGVLSYSLSQPTITKNVFRGNSAGQGGGIYIYGDPVNPDDPSDPTVRTSPAITHNTFENNQAIIEHGFSPPNADYPAIEHGDGGAIVCFQGCDAAIANNTILGNYADYYGGGIHLRQWSNGLIAENMIFDNDSFLGAGIHLTYNASPLVQDNTIRGNSGVGSGIYIIWQSAPVVEGNLILNNTVGISIYPECNPILRNNMIVRNNDSGISIVGSEAFLLISHNTISDNLRSGIRCRSDSRPIVEHNIITGNGAGVSNGYGIYAPSGSSPAIRFNNVWNNVAGNYGPDFPSQTGIQGNISIPPGFIDPDNFNYHLNYDSGCLNAGDPDYDGPVLLDYDGESRKMGQAIDIGADEARPVWNVIRSQSYFTIQEAIDGADHLDEIKVTPGCYPENIRFQGKNVSLESMDSEDWDIVERTIIDGNQLDSVVKFIDQEDPNAILSGFTITSGGATSHGGGIQVGNGSVPTIRNTIICNNYASVKGGGIYYSDTSLGIPVLTGNRITRNVSDQEGGGVCSDSGASVWMLNNVITNNYADRGGGGVMIFDGSVGSSSVLAGNIITGNRCGDTSSGGGICLWHAEADVVNNTIVGNRATQGGGIYTFADQEQWIANNILMDNILGGGIYGVGDPADSLVMVSHNNVYQNSPANYSGGTDRTGQSGNISVDPNFVDRGYWEDGGTPSDPNDDLFISGNFHLLPGSYCIDAGEMNAVPVGLLVDIDGESRTFGAAVDIGADEYFTTRSDINRDGIVDLYDLFILIEEWSDTGENLQSDIHEDGSIDLRDYAALAENWLWTGGWYD
jgi:parallel beta-helix repeat protein